METIVVGLDGSKSSQAAARFAAGQAKLSGAHIVAVHAVPRAGLWSMSAMQINIDPVLAELAKELAGSWAAPLRKAGVEYTTQVVRGDPATELLRVAQRARASMLVLGTRSHGAVADLVVGGTVHKVINRSTVPVVLVPVPLPAKPAATTRKTTGRQGPK